MTEKKSTGKPRAANYSQKAKLQSAASQSAHAALVSRVRKLEEQIDYIARSLSIDLEAGD